MIERRCQTRIAVTACHDFGVWPNLETDLSERATVFFGCATGKENSGAIDFRRQLGKNPAQTLGRGKPKIRRRQFSVLQNAKFGAGCIHHYLYERPGGFSSPAFDPEDPLTGFHDGLSIAVSERI